MNNHVEPTTAKILEGLTQCLSNLSSHAKELKEIVEEKVQQVDSVEDNEWNNSIQDLRDKWDSVNDLLSDSGRLKWYPELLDGIIDCITTEEQRKTILFLLEKKLKEINEEL